MLRLFAIAEKDPFRAGLWAPSSGIFARSRPFRAKRASGNWYLSYAAKIRARNAQEKADA
jgi:hypothetical protein